MLVPVILWHLDGYRRHHSQELAASSQLFLPVAITEQAVIANALESVGQSVEEKSADEFLSRKRHRFLLTFGSIVFPLEPHLPSFDVQQAMVRNRDAVSVPANIVEHLLRAGKWRFGVDDPFGFS